MCQGTENPSSIDVDFEIQSVSHFFDFPQVLNFPCPSFKSCILDKNKICVRKGDMWSFFSDSFFD